MSGARTSMLLAALLVLAGCGGDGANRPADVAPPPAPAIEYTAEGVRRAGDGWRADSDGAELLLVPAGHRRLGDDAGRYDEQPMAEVELDAFFIDRHEVSNAQFARFLEATGYSPQGPWQRGFQAGEELLPVRFVTWFDAQAYARWAGRRLPTEAEWEAACGAARYPWGDEWHAVAVTDRALDAGPLAASREGDRSAHGVLNLGGNVREWCGDWYDRYIYRDYAAQGLASNPRGPEDGAPPRPEVAAAGAVAGNERSTRKAVRGGAWFSPGPEFARRARRHAHNPHHYFNDVGFRCALSAREAP